MPWIARNHSDLCMARHLARFALLAYDNDQLLREYDRLKPDRVCLLECRMGFVIDCDDEVIVSFAGSTDPIDWAFNLTISQVPAFGGRVHEGFATRLDHLSSEVLSSVQRFTLHGKPIRVTGHSLGGAVATLAGLFLTSAGFKPDLICTFGAPKVGNCAFARRYSLCHARWETASDPVPCLPLIGDWEPVGQQHYLTTDHRAYRPDNTWLDNLVVALSTVAGPRAKGIASDHPMATYLQHIEKVIGGSS